MNEHITLNALLQCIDLMVYTIDVISCKTGELFFSTSDPDGWLPQIALPYLSATVAEIKPDDGDNIFIYISD